MPLIDLKTDLKSLKYGEDRPSGGSSGQPYIQTDINNPGDLIASNLDDGFVRNGIVGAARASAIDGLRIKKLFDDKPRGLNFIKRQIGLQQSNPKLEIRKTPDLFGILSGDLSSLFGFNPLASNTLGAALQPTRLYNNGINTLAQIPVNAFGVHFNRHGLLPVQDDGTKYLAVAQANNQARGGKNNRLVLLKEKFKLGDGKGEQRTNTGVNGLLNRLLGLANQILPIKFNPRNLTIDNYIGGPGSVYGLGNTLIKRFDNTESKTGNKQLPQESGLINYAGLLGVSRQYYNNNTGEIIRYIEVNPLAPTSKPPVVDQTAVEYKTNVPAGANPYGSSISPTLRTYRKLKETVDKQKNKARPQVINNSKDLPYNNINRFGIFGADEAGNTPFDRMQYNNTATNLTDPTFLPTINNENPEYYNGSKLIRIPIVWNKVARENRVGSGKQDIINLTPIFNTTAGSIGDTVTIPGVIENQNINDLVKFRIQALNGTDPTRADWMIFRAYLTQFTDNVDASWGEIKYIGRGDKFYIYDGFTRKISIGFKVAALSAEEMKPMYQKLNYLMGNLMPDYNDQGLMRGPLVKMSVGNWIDGQPGILNSLNYTVPQDSPWEISINTVDGAFPLILPHVIEVNMTFTPIGSQTQSENKISSKDFATSHLAQNYNKERNQYITGSIPNITIPNI